MKILMSAFACDPYSGSEPAGGWGWSWYNALQGMQTWCITRKENQHNIEKFLKNNPNDNLRFIFIQGSPVLFGIYKKFPALGIYPYYLHWQYKAYQQAKRLNEEVGLDIIHHVSYGSLQLGSFMWKLPVPFIFGPVGGGQHAVSLFKAYFYRAWWMERLRFLISFILTRIFANTRKTVAFASFVPVTNRPTYTLAGKLGGSNIDYFLDTGLKPGFVPVDRPVRIPSGELKVLWVGKMIPRKGLMLALDVIGQIPEELPIKLTVLGGGPDLEMFRKEIQKRGLNERVRCLGKVPFEKIPEYYLSHDVFMFCSLRDSFGSQLLEAMAYGLPILTLDMHGAEVFVPEGAGIKVPVTALDAVVGGLRDGLIHFLENPEKREAFSRVSYEAAKSETWPERVSRMQQKYLELSMDLIPA